MKAARAGEPASPRARRNAVLCPRGDRLLAELRRVREDPADADAVHDARVAARRMLAAGELWASGEPAWDALRDRLARLVRRLGRLRNFDVVIELLAKGPREDRGERRLLSKALRRRRRKERARVAAWLTADRIRRLSKELRTLRNGSAARLPRPEDLSIHFTRILSLSILSPWTRDPEAAHEVRREVRRLRYSHETLKPEYPEADYERGQKALLEVQDLAGTWQDRCVLERLSARAVRHGWVGTPLERLRTRAAEEGRELACRFVLGVRGLVDLRPRFIREGR
jgi:CHAD domain-containing protein